MSAQSKERIKRMIAKDVTDICLRASEMKKCINDSLEDALEYLNALIAQIPQSASGPLIAKTPKVLRRKGVPKIETIPEDDVGGNNTTLTHLQSSAISIDENKIDESTSGRVRRKAYVKAGGIIKHQQSLTLNTKLRRPSGEHNTTNFNKSIKEETLKRRKTARTSSDEEQDDRRPSKHSKLESKELRSTLTQLEVDARVSERSQIRRSTRKRSSLSLREPDAKKSNIIDDTLTMATPDDMEEASMYEDAIGKPTPIMNSTLKPNSTMTVDKMMNVTVVLEHIPKHSMKLNETITIKKPSTDRRDERTKAQEDNFSPVLLSKKMVSSKNALPDRLQQLKNAMANGDFDDLMTDDESSPDTRRTKAEANKQAQKAHIKKERKPPSKQKVMSISSDDEVVDTPTKPFREPPSDVRSAFKSSALFSPYAKESVRKRVEAFEQAGLNSPKSLNIDAPTRLTRTKARAMAAAEAEKKIGEKTVARKLARKSVARAKKISLAKQIKDTDDTKENKAPAQKATKITNEKVNMKQQQRTTPLGKTRTQLPMSVNRVQHTPANSHNLANTKALTASRTNIVTTMDSFIQSSKPASKPTSADKFEEKRRNEEDAKRKREETLRLQTEERRRKRQEKELKNKLAREAKEKQEMEKRLKAEKEREEKARLAQQMQEKQKEELEKKKLAQLQRAQEKEERRRHEEQQRLQRLQEQEEAERLLAEQRRREQEAERRKEAEVRAQMQVAAEAMKHQTQMLMHSKVKQQANNKHHTNNKHHAPTNYVLDSEPDDDESDDESRPKHTIPHWAQSQVRKQQLALQRYIPERSIFDFFDTKRCTPDLTELFHGIDRSRLKRTSSAIWKTPPRYSMMEAV